MFEVINDKNHNPSCSASIQKNQIKKPPIIELKLFPEPPVITIIQIKKIYLRG